MDLSDAHSYESTSGSAVDEYELNDISQEIHVRLQDGGAHEKLLKDENSREVFASVTGSKLKHFINLTHGHHRPKIGPLQENARRVAWQAGIRWVTIGAALILLFNIVVTISLGARFGISNGVATLYTGDCTTVSRMDSGLHIAINLLSTAFLSASNYVMQILNAPSRKQVDDFHARGASLNIGIPSFENAMRLGNRQTILWVFLGISAIPLHLFWNSAIFTTLQANQYNIFLVSSDFNTTDFNCSLGDSCNRAKRLYNLTRIPSGLEYLDNASCMEDYSVDFLTSRGNLLLVTNSTAALYPNGTKAIEGTVFGMLDSTNWNIDLNNQHDWNPVLWWCQSTISNIIPLWTTTVKPDGSSCSMSEAIAQAADLAFVISSGDSERLAIQYCLSESTPGLCHLGFTVYIMIIVILCNIIKVASMVCSLWALTDEPLVVIGDALSSFLEVPDANTEGCCLMEAPDDLSVRNSRGRVWRFKRHHWFYVPTPFSIVRCFICCIITLTAAGYLLNMGIAHIPSFSSIPFEGVSPSAVITNFLPDGGDPSSFAALALAVLVANLPQLIFSTLYFMYNRLLTTMLAMDEWCRFAYRSATLRVSYPSRSQRSTYWLHLPYTYGVPLLVTTTMMHWLVAQSLFLARVQIYDPDGNPSGVPILSTPGYSPKAIVASIALGSSMLLFLVGLGLRRYKGGIPLIGNNSLAISAACHPPADDNDPAHSEVMWGAVAHEYETIPGHCCLTSKPVTPPLVGNRYAGLRKVLYRPV